MTDENLEELRVTFHPQLYLQRQSWVLDILRREAVESVLDIGCGEGSLLQCLTEPSWSLPPDTSLTEESPFVSGPSAQYYTDLHLKEIHGLDPYTPDLEFAIAGTAPPDPDALPFNGYERWVRRNARWTPLEVSLWQGGFETINEAFEGDRIDAFVASEVIEHLSPDLLPLFAPILLGHYRPRLLLLTTPNYTYNQRFARPGELSPTSYADPTGRTNRVFRHHDHKSEWTTEEWTQYCKTAASDFGYTVDIGGLGLAVESDPWNREAKLGYASQVAAFRRLDAKPPKTSNIDSLHEKSFARAQPHVLRAKHHHLTHPLSPEELARPPVMDDIRQAVKVAMNDQREGTMTFADLWKQGEVSLKCAGDIGVLVRAFEEAALDSEEWAVEHPAKGWEGNLVWKSFGEIRQSCPFFGAALTDSYTVATEEPSLQPDIEAQNTHDWQDNYTISGDDELHEPLPQAIVPSPENEAVSTASATLSTGWGQEPDSWGSVLQEQSDPWGWDETNADPRSTGSWVSSVEHHAVAIA